MLAFMRRKQAYGRCWMVMGAFALLGQNDKACVTRSIALADAARATDCLNVAPPAAKS